MRKPLSVTSLILSVIVVVISMYNENITAVIGWSILAMYDIGDLLKEPKNTQP